MQLGNQQFSLAHLAIAVAGLDQAAPLYQALGFALGDTEIIEREHVRLQVVSRGDLRIELLEPHPAGAGPIAKFLEKRGPGLHHIALHSTNLDSDIATLNATGIGLLKGYPASGAHKSRVAFLDPKTTGGVLFELVEPATL
jgi:methylmalonyl-CoA epimerase